MIINAENAVAGRIATVAAKKALEGEKISIVNAEKAVITGTVKTTLEKEKQKTDRGIPLKGPYFPKQPDRYLRRIVRGMLPYKKPRGREAYKRVMCYKGIPKEFENQKLERIEEADVSKIPNLKYVTIKDICRHTGGKVE